MNKPKHNWSLNYWPSEEVRHLLWAEGRGNFRKTIDTALKLYFKLNGKLRDNR
jgi:hypothetical protein